MTKSITSSSMKKIYMIGLLVLSSQWVLGQCSDMKIAALVKPASCGILNDGQIVLQVQGGKEPYAYDWSNGSKAQLASGLSAGTYEVTVTDAVGCETFFSQAVDVNTELTLTTEITAPTNSTSADGILKLNPSGGVGPYTFQISDYSNVQSIRRFSSQEREITGLKGGRYAIDVIDSKGCINTVMIKISSSDQ